MFSLRSRHCLCELTATENENEAALRQSLEKVARQLHNSTKMLCGSWIAQLTLGLTTLITQIAS